MKGKKKKCKVCRMDAAPEAKFCIDCGGETIEESEPLTKCASCGHESEGKFCGECGESLAKAEYDETMEALELLARVNSKLPRELEIEPIEDDTLPPLKKAEGGTSQGDELIDAYPIVEALFKGHNGLINGQDAIGREVRTARQEIGTLAKAVLALMRDNRELREMIGAWGDRPAGRRGIVARAANVDVLQKSVSQARDNPGTRITPELMAKAIAAQAEGKFEAADVGKLNIYSNRGFTVERVMEVDASLAAKLPLILPQ